MLKRLRMLRSPVYLQSKIYKMEKHVFARIGNIYYSSKETKWDNVEKFGGARGARNDATKWRIRVACWISMATCRHAHAHAHVPEHTRTQIHICNIYCVYMATKIRERASLLRYSYFVLFHTTRQKNNRDHKNVSCRIAFRFRPETRSRAT